jgi:hypothetical protein
LALARSRSELRDGPNRYPGLRRRIPGGVGVNRRLFFTASKLLKSRRIIFIPLNSPPFFLSLPQTSLILHSFCTSAKCFSVAVHNNLPHSGFTECVRSFKACRTAIAARLAADRQFSRVNCRGKSEACVSARRSPGHCGLPHIPLYELGLGRWPLRRLQGCGSHESWRATVTVNVALSNK